MKKNRLKKFSHMIMLFTLIIVGICFKGAVVHASMACNDIVIYTGETYTINLTKSNSYLATTNGNNNSSCTKTKDTRENATATIKRGNPDTLTLKGTNEGSNYFFVWNNKKKVRAIHIKVFERPQIASITHTSSSSTNEDDRDDEIDGDIHIYTGDYFTINANFEEYSSYRTGVSWKVEKWEGNWVDASNDVKIDRNYSSSTRISVPQRLLHGGSSDTYKLTITSNYQFKCPYYNSTFQENTSASHSAIKYASTSSSVLLYVYPKPTVNVLQNGKQVKEPVYINRNYTNKFSILRGGNSVWNNTNAEDVETNIIVPSAYDSMIGIEDVDDETGYFSVMTKDAFTYDRVAYFTVRCILNGNDSVCKTNGPQIISTNIQIKLGKETLIKELSFEKETYKAKIGDTFYCYPLINPSDVPVNKKFIWKSSDSDVAEVDSSGHVKCKKIGSVTISVSAQDGGDASADYELLIAAEKLEQLAGKMTSMGPKIYWGSIKGIKKYSVYRSEGKNGNYKYVGKTNGEYFIDKKAKYNKKYYYKVIAVPDDGEEYEGSDLKSDYSDVVCIDTRILSPKVTVKKVGKSYKIKLFGQKYSGYKFIIGKKKIITKKKTLKINYKYVRKVKHIKVRSYKKVGKKKIYYSKSVSINL